MATVETLTAYKCKFSYLQRNNPLIEEQREAIKAGEKPEYSFSDFVVAYQSYAANMAIGENTDRAIILTEEKITRREKDGVRVWDLSPSAGKQGKPVTVIKNHQEENMILYQIRQLYMNTIFLFMRMMTIFI